MTEGNGSHCGGWPWAGRDFLRSMAFVCAAFLVLMMMAPAALRSQQPARKPSPSGTKRAAASRPSLDALASRVRAYWALLARGKKAQAVSYVESSTRDAFLVRSTPDFSSPRLTDISLGARDDEVDVTVHVKRLMPPLAGEFDFRVIERWVLRKGLWYVVIKTGTPPYANTGASHDAPPELSPAEAQRRQALLRKEMHFATEELNFGTVDQGSPVNWTLRYRLEGNKPAQIRVAKGPSALDPRGVIAGQISPGDGKLETRFLTAERDSPVEEPFTIVVSRDDVEVPFEFVLKGTVYAPISVTPRPLRFSKDEAQGTVTLRNNSSSTIRIDRYFNENPKFKAEPVPLGLEPGGTATLQITRPLDITTPNTIDRIGLIFAEIVDGKGNVSVPLVLNYVEVAPRKSNLPAEVEEWMRRNKPRGMLPPR